MALAATTAECRVHVPATFLGAALEALGDADRVTQQLQARRRLRLRRRRWLLLPLPPPPPLPPPARHISLFPRSRMML
eukprot:scaffold94008_cov38-Phaeocystis_antarctica.AAC.1